MKIGRFWKVAAFAGALAGSAALVAAASGATGAYFNDTANGQVTGNVGSIKVDTSASGGAGGDHLAFHLTNMLPGTKQTIAVHYENSGLNNEDVYLVFTNAEALHSVNNLGHFGAVTIASSNGATFKSSNLADGLTATLKPITPNSDHCSSTPNANVKLSPSGCWPVPTILKLATNLAPGTTGTMSFSFTMGARFKTPAIEGKAFFCYPLIQNPNTSTPTTQVCRPTTHHFGLPYEIVATQHGIAPNNPTNTNPTP